ncbi:MAG: hypothetical protein WD766_06995 [Gemmatimonadota bacterium]
MHEHIRNVNPSWIAFGWFIAAAVTALILLALASLGLVGEDPPGETLWVASALLVGFFTTGFFVGTRVAAAPILHGLGIGLFSIVAWLLINISVGGLVGETTWRSLDAITLGALLLLQTVAAVVGARMGVRWLRTPPAHS